MVEGAEYEINTGSTLPDPEAEIDEMLRLGTLSVDDLEIIIQNQDEDVMSILQILGQTHPALLKEYLERGAEGLPDELREDYGLG